MFHLNLSMFNYLLVILIVFVVVFISLSLVIADEKKQIEHIKLMIIRNESVGSISKELEKLSPSSICAIDMIINSGNINFKNGYLYELNCMINNEIIRRFRCKYY